MKKSVDISGTTITFTWTNGDEAVQEMTFNTAELPENIMAYAAMHGLKQKLSDSLASQTVKAGYSPADHKETLEALWEQLMDGHWNSPSRKGGGGLSLKAMAKKAGLSEEEIKKRLAAAGLNIF